MGIRSERLGQRRAFWFAWFFLIFIVAVGFFVQKRTIDRLEHDERTVAVQIERALRTTTTNAEALCVLLVSISPEDQPAIVTAFRDLGYSCDGTGP